MKDRRTGAVVRCLHGAWRGKLEPGQGGAAPVLIAAALLVTAQALKTVWFDLVLVPWDPAAYKMSFNLLFSLALSVLIVVPLLRTRRVIPLVVFWAAQTLYLAGSLSYYKYSGAPPAVGQILLSLPEAWGALRIGAAPVSREMLVLLADLPFLVAAFLAIRSGGGERLAKIPAARLAAALLIVLILAATIRGLGPRRMWQDRYAGGDQDHPGVRAADSAPVPDPGRDRL